MNYEENLEKRIASLKAAEVRAQNVPGGTISEQQARALAQDRQAVSRARVALEAARMGHEDLAHALGRPLFDEALSDRLFALIDARHSAPDYALVRDLLKAA